MLRFLRRSDARTQWKLRDVLCDANCKLSLVFQINLVFGLSYERKYIDLPSYSRLLGLNNYLYCCHFLCLFIKKKTRGFYRYWLLLLSLQELLYTILLLLEVRIVMFVLYGLNIFHHSMLEMKRIGIISFFVMDKRGAYNHHWFDHESIINQKFIWENFYECFLRFDSFQNAK